MKLLALIVFFSLAFLPGISQSPLTVVEGPRQYPILRHMSFYTDSTNQLGIRDIRKIQLAGGFKEDKRSYHNFGVNTFNNWSHFKLSNKVKQKRLVLDVADRYMDSVELYIFKDKELFLSTKTTGWKLSFSERPIPGVRQAFPVNLNNSGEYSCFLKFHRSGGTTVGVVFLQTPKLFYQEAMMEDHISYIVQGSVFFLIIAGLTLFYISRDIIYLLYVIQNTALLFFVAAQNGILNFYLLGKWDFFAGPPSNFISSIFYSCTHLIFVMSFFRVRLTFGKWLHSLGLVLLAFEMILLLLLLTTLMPVLKFQFLYIAYLLSAIYSVLIIVVGINRRNRNAIIYGIAETPLVFVIVYYTYAIFSHVSISWIPLYGFQIAPLFEIMVFAIALAERFAGYQKENTLLLSDLSEAKTQVIDIQDAERQRIAQDLHDELGGNLAAIKMVLQRSDINPTQGRALMDLIDSTSIGARNIAHNLMPPEFVNTPLPDLLQNQVLRLNNEGLVQFYFYCINYQEHLFNKQHELMLYRIIMELSSNIVKHANALDSTIQLVGYHKYLEVIVEDDGQGFVEEEKAGFGIKSIKSRVNFLRGQMHLDSNKKGTTVVIKIPYHPL